MKSKKAIVVGSGIAGIASAIRLAVAGYSVEIYEKNEYAGGKLSVFEKDGFRFDGGPSLFTMPQFVEELFLLAGRKTEDYFKYQKSQTACHYFFEDGTFLRFFADEAKLLREIEEKLEVSSKPLYNRLKKSAYIYKNTHKSFLEMSLHRWKNFFSKEILKTVFAILRLELFSSMHAANVRNLNHPKLVQIFDRFATYNGSNPYQAPGILNVIPHLEHGFGTFFPNGGMRSIVESLLHLASDLGIVVHLNKPVEEILTEERRIKGIVVDSKPIFCDLIVCNSDIRPAYRQLLPQEKIPAQVQSQEPSSSALIFYWGMNLSESRLDLHNIFFSEKYEEEFKAIFKSKTCFHDPTIYVHVSSKMKPDDAPNGKENWFVMINAPSNDGQNWEAFRTEARKNIVDKLSRMLKKDIEALIEVEEFLDPIRIEERTSSYAGALYGASSNDRSAAFFRHPNFSSIEGLYFVGGSVHPGGGIPLCLLSAKIAVEDHLKNVKR